MKKVITYPLMHNSIDDIIKVLSAAILRGEGEDIMLLVPTGQLFHEVRRRLLENDEIKGYGDVRLLSFDGLITSFLEAGGVERRLLGVLGRELLISRIVQDLFKERRLVYFNPLVEFKGFRISMIKAISELKRSSISPEEFLKAIQGSSGVTFKKYMDLYLIYQRYQEELKRLSLVDHEECYHLAREFIDKDSSLLKVIDKVIMAEFYDFTPSQFEILAAISDSIPEIEIYLPFEENREAVYAHTASTLKSLKKIGFEIVSWEGEDIGVERSKSLKHLQENIFHLEPPTYSNGDDLWIMCAPDMEREIRECGRKIKKLIISGKYEPSDILLVVRDLPSYIRIISEQFQYLGIPCNLDYEEPLSEHPLTRALIKLVEIKIEGWSRQSVLKVVKTGYIKKGLKLDGDLLELLAAPYIIDSKTSWEELLQIEKSKGQEDDLSTGLEELKEGFNRLELLVEKFPHTASPWDYTIAMREVIKELQLYQIVLNPQTYSDICEPEFITLEFKRELSALKGLEESLDLLDTAFQDVNYNDQALTIEDFLSYWKDALGELSITLNRGNSSGVRVLGVSSARGLSFPVAFICGLVDGIFPCREGTDWLYTGEDRAFLKSEGLHLAGGYISSSIERFLFAMAVTRGRNELHLSYPLIGPSQEEELPSPFLSEVLSLFQRDAIPIQKIEISTWLPESYRDAAAPFELSQMLIMNMRDMEVGEIGLSEESISPFIPKERWMEILLKIKAERERYGREFGSFDGYIKGDKVSQGIEERFGGTFRFSAGQFRDYSLCPFAFFLGRVLNLAPWEEAIQEEEVDSLSKGDIYHRVLAIFLSKHSGTSLEREKSPVYLRELKEILDEVCKECGVSHGVIHPKLWTIEKEAILKDLTRWLLSELDDLYGSNLKWTPSFLEWSFGMPSESKGSTNKPLRLSREGEELFIRGKVDRIDSHNDGRYSIYDYKTYKGVSFNDMLEGIDLQIPIYLKAVQLLLCKPGEKVIGGGYYSLKQAGRLHGVWRESVAPDLIFRKSKRSGNLNDEEWDEFFDGVEEKLFDMRSRILQGDFSLTPPKECASYCKFIHICRYDRTRIARKLQEEENHEISRF